MDCLIGHTGLVGSTLKHFHNFQDMYNSKNIAEIQNKHYRTIYCSGVAANKFWANQHPDEDWTGIDNLITHLKTVTCDKFILISTIDVYDVGTPHQTESNFTHPATHPYGANRLRLENIIQDMFTNILIVRLPALFGFGLKKNVIYDLIHHNQIEKININSAYQWYYLSNLYDDIQQHLHRKIINLFPAPVETNQILEIFNQCSGKSLVLNSGGRVIYDIKSDHFSSGYLDRDIKPYLEFYINVMARQNLILSNLAYPSTYDVVPLEKFGIHYQEIAPFKFNGDIQYFFNSKFDVVSLKKFGMHYQEIAPFKFNNNNEYFFNSDFSQRCRDVKTYSFQGWLFPHLINLFTQPEQFKKYTTSIIDLAQESDVKILVLGSPRNRYKPDIHNKSDADMIADAITLFKYLGDYAKERGVVLAIEPNATEYGCNFITNSKEGLELVNLVDSPGFQLHLDVGNMFMEHEDVEHLPLDKVCHIHFSAPHMKPLDKSELNYISIYNNLMKQGYTGKIGIEYMDDGRPTEEILFKTFV